MAAKANADTSVAANNTNYTAPLVALFDLECTRLHLPIVLLKKIFHKKPRPLAGLLYILKAKNVLKLRVSPFNLCF